MHLLSTFKVYYISLQILIALDIGFKLYTYFFEAKESKMKFYIDFPWMFFSSLFYYDNPLFGCRCVFMKGYIRHAKSQSRIKVTDLEVNVPVVYTLV